MVSDHGEDDASQEGGYNLRNTDGTIEETQIGTHVTIALQGIGNIRERHGEHGGPSTTYHEERNDL